RMLSLPGGMVGNRVAPGTRSPTRVTCSGRSSLSTTQPTLRNGCKGTDVQAARRTQRRNAGRHAGAPRMVRARRCPRDDAGRAGGAAPCPSRVRKEPLMRKKQWKDLTTEQKRGIVFLGVLQLALLITALIDIRRRPADAINGSKRLWTAIVFI